MDNDLASLLKFGIVRESRPGFARVALLDMDDLKTMWLPILYPKTQDDQAVWTFDQGEHVALLLDARCEDGVILGAIYSDQDTPPITDSNQFYIRFKDGATLHYDRSSHVLSVKGVEKLIVESKVSIELHAAASVKIDTPYTEMTGQLHVKGTLLFDSGMQGKGAFQHDGDIHASGEIIDAGGNSNHHVH